MAVSEMFPDLNCTEDTREALETVVQGSIAFRLIALHQQNAFDDPALREKLLAAGFTLGSAEL